tara:strand:- start:3318 stop:4067 length:750 start_codon:yes stop_codon:yes gene_type:complete
MRTHLKSSRPFNISTAIAAGYVKTPYRHKAKGGPAKSRRRTGGKYKSRMQSIDLEWSSIRHTVNALGEIEAAMKQHAVDEMRGVAFFATDHLVANTREIQSTQGFHNWKYLFFPTKPPASVKSRHRDITFAYFGISTEDKYYEPRGDKGGTIIEFLNYGTRSGYQIHLKSKSAFSFNWPGGSRTGNPGALTSLPKVGTKKFLGLPPTRDYLIHPGIRPFGFIEKAFQMALFDLMLTARSLRQIKYYVGV